MQSKIKKTKHPNILSKNVEFVFISAQILILEGSFLITYLSLGQPVTIVMKKIAGTRVKARWFVRYKLGQFGYGIKIGENVRCRTIL